MSITLEQTDGGIAKTIICEEIFAILLVNWGQVTHQRGYYQYSKTA